MVWMLNPLQTKLSNSLFVLKKIRLQSPFNSSAVKQISIDLCAICSSVGLFSVNNFNKNSTNACAAFRNQVYSKPVSCKKGISVVYF